MLKTGTVELGLHSGFAPQWLLARMKGLARSIVTLIIDEYGPSRFLERLADPLWFQALAAVLGFDFDSSGTTSVTCNVLKTVLDPEKHKLVVAGGKGRKSRNTKTELDLLKSSFSFSDQIVDRLRYSSRMCAKVDTAAIQAGYQLYHHCIFVDEMGDWAVVQQGMNVDAQVVRRYHWLSKDVRNFVEEPHSGIIGSRRHQRVLDMTAPVSDECRRIGLDIVNDRVLHKEISSLPRRNGQRSLIDWVDPNPCVQLRASFLPENINWKGIEAAYDRHPCSYEELLSLPGIGPAAVRGLALVAEIVYGAEPSWQDPVKYSFAYGGKDGVPFPVDCKAMDESIKHLEDAVTGARIEDSEKRAALRRLASAKLEN